jgi:hypothetical protein
MSILYLVHFELTFLSHFEFLLDQIRSPLVSLEPYLLSLSIELPTTTNVLYRLFFLNQSYVRNTSCLFLCLLFMVSSFVLF